MQRNALLISTLTLGGLLAACGEVPHARLFDFWESLGGDEDSSGGDDGETSEGAVSDDGDADPSDGGDGDTDSDDGDDGCVPVPEAVDVVQVPADIIFVVDNSDGMLEAAILVQAQMNGFSAQLGMSGIDHHIVLISSYPDNGNGICVNPPLGSGSCPHYDNHPPVYRHVDEKVGNDDALASLIATQSQWKDSIRPDSVTHVVVVSNDESEHGPKQLESLLEALDGSYEHFVFHAIVCPWDCPDSAGIGQTYIDLVYQTGGVLGDLCQKDFQAVFDQLANAVMESVPSSCQFDIPPPPTGMTFDPNLVNVELDNGGLEDIPRVTDLADCMNQPEGWYYDDPGNPTQIVLCPQTCTEQQEYAQDSINVKFGCETLIPE